MPTRPLPRIAFALIFAARLASGAAAAQTAGCTYVRCALRIEDHAFGPAAPRLVQGLEARTVATIGLFAPRIALLDSSPASVRLPYQAFRRYVNRSGVLWIVGATTALSSILFLPQARRGHPGALIGLISLGTGISVAGLFERARGKAVLELAVRRYNEALPNGP